MNQPALESQSEHFSLEVIPQWTVNFHYVSVKTNYFQRMQKVNFERLTIAAMNFVWLALRMLLKEQEKGCTALV